MKTYKGISNFNSEKGTIVTIGTFDGVHLGHKKILSKLISEAKLKDLEPTIFTFYPHPRMVLQQDTDLKLINTLEEKTAILDEFGIKNLVVYPFTKEFSRLTALEFVRDILVNSLNTKKIIIGYDHRFGRNRTASIDDLKEFGKSYNFEVEEITAKEINEVSISSTKIRKALLNGDINTANTYLDYEYMITGEVVYGQKLGRTINFPTANLVINNPYKLIPKSGVYIVKSYFNDQVIYGMMNIGTNPTVNGNQKTIETYFFDFNNDLYQQELQISFLHRIRDEKKFESLDDLKLQLQKDQDYSKAFITKYHAQ